MNWAKTIPAGEAAEGLILAGPPGAPAAVQIPVRLHNITTGTATKTFTAVADTHLSAAFPTATAGSAPQMYVGGSDLLRSIVKFDTSSIASMYTVQSAKLKVYVDGYGSSGDQHTLKAYGITTPWAESTATWKTPWTLPGGDFGPVVGSAAISKDDVGKWVTVDVTSLVSQWVQYPSDNNGVLLKAVSDVSYATFRLATREYWFTDKVPTLEVTYGIP